MDLFLTLNASIVSHRGFKAFILLAIRNGSLLNNENELKHGNVEYIQNLSKVLTSECVCFVFSEFTN